MTNKFDYIIVGQGLAGSCLAFHLQQLGQKVLIIDEQKDNTSSKIAAGLYNPITGRKMVLTWKAHLLFDYLYEFYKNIEQKLSKSFLYDTTIYRPFVSLEEQNEWMGKSADENYTPFIKKLHSSPTYGQHLKDEFGGLALKKCGYLDISEFLNASEKYFRSRDLFLNEVFDYNCLEIGETVAYKDFKAEKIIFCTGTEATTGTFFSWLPFNLVKGEVLEITPESDFEQIYNRGVFIMPRRDEKYIVGATYDTKDLTYSITEKARNTLIEKLEVIFKLDYNISGQKAGIRPATKDRKPFVGMHPETDKVGIFNGLGTKGVTLAPYFAKQFSEYLVNGKDVDNEVNVSRYYSLYFRK
ncbi:MAG: FAD-binding oxidoreductase [Cyclobacteriaceae bacterium]|nr:FAD-binding oxidoreductase [Cyclobacteriaceae bacterium]